MIKNANILTYYTLVVRDLSVLIITVIFLIRVGIRENSLKQQLVMKEDLMDMMDLSAVLGSVTPLIAFSKYLEEKKSSHSHLLRFIKMVKIFEDQNYIHNEIKENLV